MYTLLMALPLMMSSCGGENISDGGSEKPTTTDVLAPIVNTQGSFMLSLFTDKALYSPGETVTFTVEGTLPSSAHVRYRHGADVVSEANLTSNTWTWTAPSTDYMGYMADIYTVDSDKKETLYATIGIDVSSDWGRFPRYGFIASYGSDKTSAVIASELSLLNRCHINGLQFYDWQYKHHWPLGGTPDGLLDSYKDIANRDIYTSVVKDYIAQCHDYGMKAMFYNLCFGVLNDAKADGVKDSWYIFKDEAHKQRDSHQLPSSWKSDIFLVDPANTDWQQYLADRNDDVYKALDFDGFHIDQLGDRGIDYTYYGTKANLPTGYASLIRAMKERQPNKSLVMNAVSNYASENIIGTGCMDFMYSELWNGEDQFSDLHDIMQKNRSASGEKLNQVYAAYMDYGHNKTEFNTPGVLLTDAVMFALGASHLELGDGHMLSSEYFPYADVKMSDELKREIVAYYDFLVAYQNFLRDGGAEAVSSITSAKADVRLNAWPPVLGTVTTYSKQVAGKRVVHLLNFRQANSLSWRDMDGSMPEPQLVSNLTLRLRAKDVKKLWVASPDHLCGAPQQLQFRQDGDYVVFTVPQLKYWTMIVAE